MNEYLPLAFSVGASLSTMFIAWGKIRSEVDSMQQAQAMYSKGFDKDISDLKSAIRDERVQNQSAITALSSRVDNLAAKFDSHSGEMRDEFKNLTAVIIRLETKLEQFERKN